MNEFKKKILKVAEPREHKFTHSYGIHDFYKYLENNKYFGYPKIRLAEFTKLFRLINTILADNLITGGNISLPANMGHLEVRKMFPLAFYKDGLLVNNYPVDWNKTLELWEDDEESMKNKVLVKCIEREVFSIRYNPSQANYTNKTFMKFYPSKELKQKLKKSIREGKTDAFYIYRK